MKTMDIEIFVINPADNREVRASDWISMGRERVIKGNWLVIRAEGMIPFKISKNNLYEKCVTASFDECKRTATFSRSRLGKESEWIITHEAKMYFGLDKIIAAMEGEVIGCKPTYTEDGTVVQSYSSNGNVNITDPSALPDNTEIYARIFRDAK